jgi:hypothetical protein
MDNDLPTYLQLRSPTRLVIRRPEGASGITRLGALLVFGLLAAAGAAVLALFSVPLGLALVAVGVLLFVVTALHVTDLGHELVSQPTAAVVFQRRNLFRRHEHAIAAADLAEVLLAVSGEVWLRRRDGDWLCIFRGDWKMCSIVAEEGARLLGLSSSVVAFAGGTGGEGDYWVFTPQRLELRRAGSEVHWDKVTTIVDLPLVVVDDGTPVPGYPPPRRYAYEVICSLAGGATYRLATTASLEPQPTPISRALREAENQRERIADAMKIRLVGKKRK